jgi:hypothetical protein
MLLINQRNKKTSQWLPKVLLYEIFKFASLSWPTQKEINLMHGITEEVTEKMGGLTITVPEKWICNLCTL